MLCLISARVILPNDNSLPDFYYLRLPRIFRSWSVSPRKLSTAEYVNYYDPLVPLLGLGLRLSWLEKLFRLVASHGWVRWVERQLSRDPFFSFSGSLFKYRLEFSTMTATIAKYEQIGQCAHSLVSFT